jgi:hypothetical protein
MYICCTSGLPDGLFAHQKSRFGIIFELLGVENVIKYFGVLLPFSAIWYLYLFYGNLLEIFTIFYAVPKKSGNPAVPTCV